QVTAEFGAVMRNGPAFPNTVTCMSALLRPPPPRWLSRAVTRKFIVRFVLGNASPGVTVLLRISFNRGNVLEHLVVGLNERKSGLLPLSAAVNPTHGPRSRSSQHQVNGSPSGSLPVALRTN